MTGLSLHELEAELIAELPERRALSVLDTGGGSSGVGQSNNVQGVQQAASTTNTVRQSAISVWGNASNRSSISTVNAFQATNVPINVFSSGN